METTSKEGVTVINMPVLICQVGPVPPMEKMALTSVQGGTQVVHFGDTIKDSSGRNFRVNANWLPFMPHDWNKVLPKDPREIPIYYLNVETRKQALKSLKEEQIHKYEYMVPYGVFGSLKSDEEVEKAKKEVNEVYENLV